MSGQIGLREKRNRRSCDPMNGFLINVSSKSSTADEAFDCKQEQNDSNSVPNFIYISTTDMSSKDGNTSFKSEGGRPPKQQKLEGASIVSRSEATNKNLDNTKLDDILAKLIGIKEEIKGFKEEIKEMNDRLGGIERKVDVLGNVARPNRDPFYRNLFVQQYDEKIAKSCPTWTLMKIQKEDHKYCIGITSAHLIRRIEKIPEGNELFIEIPKALYDVGVEAVLLHNDILKNHLSNSNSHNDIMIVVLANLPTINGKKADWDELMSYPKTKVTYKKEWLDADAIGKSRRGFVIGRRVAEVKSTKSNELKYKCTMSSGERGDSGTLLWAITDSNEKDLIGIYKGSEKSDEHNAEGTITPALGWKDLEWIDALNVRKVSVKYKYKKKKELVDISEELTNTYMPEEKMGRCRIKPTQKDQEKFGTVIKVPTSMNYTPTSSRSKEDEHAPYEDVCNSDVGSCCSSDQDSCYYSDVDSCSSDQDSCYSGDEFH